MRIIRRKMEQKERKSTVHSTKPKTPRHHHHKATKGKKRPSVVPEIPFAANQLDPSPPKDVFAAVEAGNLEEVKRFVESAADHSEINSKGPLYLTPLELAVLLHHRPIIKYLLLKGGTESDQCEAIIERLKEEVRNNLNDDRMSEQNLWEKRRKNIRWAMLGWDQLKRPEKPKLFVEPISSDSVMVVIAVRETTSIITKLRVQWSTSPIFDVFNERIIAANPQNFKFIIPNLDPASRYFFRAYAGNIKDWSSLASFSLCCASWKKPIERAPRQSMQLDDLHAKFRAICDCDVSLSSKSSDEKVQNSRKKGPIQLLFNSTTAKFVRSTKRGIYIAFIFYSREKTVLTLEDCVPCIEVCDSATSLSMSDFTWLLKVSRSWFNLKVLRIRSDNSPSWETRRKLISTLKMVQAELGVADLGQLHHQEIRVSEDAVLLPFVKLQDPETLGVGKWHSIEKVGKRLLSTALLEEMVRSHEATTTAVPRGLYLAYLSAKTSLNSLLVMTAKQLSMLPHVKIRENPFVCSEEWEILSENKFSGSYLTELQVRFLHDLQGAAADLTKSLPDASSARFFTHEVVELSENVALVLVRPEKVCQVVTDESSLRTSKTSLPHKIFELLNFSVYQPAFSRKYFELSCCIELELHLATLASREAFSSEEIEIAKDRLRKLQEVSDDCREIRRHVGWLSNVIQAAQDDKNVERTPTLREIVDYKKAQSSTIETSTPKIKVRHHHKTPLKHHHPSPASTLMAKKVEDLRTNVQNVKLLDIQPETSILQVYAAYDTGLPSGTSLKLRVTPKTTAREVINLVVKQLNMAVVLKGKEGPIYDAEELKNFCLVAIIGARERSLRDDFRPLTLQNPWKKGTLYVRQKHDLLAAIEHSSHQTTI